MRTCILPTLTLCEQLSEPTLQKLGVAMEYIPNSWNFSETFRIFRLGCSLLAHIVFIFRDRTVFDS